MLSFVKNLNFWHFFKICTFHVALCPYYVKVKSLLLQQLFISMMIPLDILKNKLSGFGQNCNFVFWANVFNYAFSLSLWGGIKDKVDSFLLQSLCISGNSIC